MTKPHEKPTRPMIYTEMVDFLLFHEKEAKTLELAIQNI